MGITKTGKKYRARYTTEGVRYNVGTFNTQEEADSALAEHMWSNPHYPGFITPEAPKYTISSKPSKHKTGDKIKLKQPITARIKARWQRFQKNLENRNLI